LLLPITTSTTTTTTTTTTTNVSLPPVSTSTHQPQLYTRCCFLLTATVYSAPQQMLLTSASTSDATALGDTSCCASPCPSCPSSPRPQEATRLQSVGAEQWQENVRGGGQRDGKRGGGRTG
jgi:hypothetical protein